MFTPIALSVLVAAVAAYSAGRVSAMCSGTSTRALLVGLSSSMGIRIAAIVGIGLACDRWAPDAQTYALLGALLVIAVGFVLDVGVRLGIFRPSQRNPSDKQDPE